ncbi:MAG: sigma-70 family RNA polymerase sigma factor [Intrasporangium sp.]|uniref:RNA polymerase sigma factor n=1 Tax=Intrasporangium sp. TaxID=1925024 RepID=UPI002647D350|nr:sigma-70 family RNA polymerase sigma factor [Intrasporangium sp.]MDN5797365.1 sigma-70 family RNA polymerase sigma factor [Intrasporangium sp.]
MRHPFEQAVAEHGGLVLRVCRAVLGPVDADDAWSETFLAALRAWPDLPDDADVRAWLVTIAHRKAIDVIRARQRAPVPVPTIPEPAGGQLGDGGPALPDHDLWRALAALPDRQRLCVAYHHVAGLPHPEVARIVGGTAAAARRASADGIATLRRTYLPSLERETHA